MKLYNLGVEGINADCSYDAHAKAFLEYLSRFRL